MKYLMAVRHGREAHAPGQARERPRAPGSLGSSECLDALVRNASDMILVVAPDGQIRLATGAVGEVLGRDAAECTGRTLVELVHPHDCALLRGLLEGTLEAGPGATERVGWRMRHSDGRWVDFEVVATNLVHDPHVAALVLSCRDISAAKAFEDQLRRQAFHDPLTQLPNRALLLDRIEQAIARDHTAVALLFVDLDDFKVVNDTLGHAAGDALLTAVAARLRGCLRSADTAARLGGDEFALLLEEVGDESEAERVANRVLDTMRRPFSLHGEPIHMSVSVGLVVAAAGASSVDELLRRADFAMYAAKRNGKCRAEQFDAAIEMELAEQFERTAPVNDEAERVTWFARAEEQRAEIEHVLEDPGARIGQVFQPIVDLRTGLVTAYEALSRFTDSRRPPNAWFAQAHRCGLGIELEMAAAQAQLDSPGRPEGTRLSINLSPSALLSAEAEERFAGDLSHVIVEVTEDELVAEGGALEERLAELRRRGAQLAVDDIGAGYAGLKQVMRLEPDVLKLDRSLVADVASDPAKGAMVDALVRYARRIGAEVCAEGVETLEDLQALADLDVTYGQGYALGRPAPPWALVDPEAAAVCTSALHAVIRHDEALDRTSSTSELQLERTCHQIGLVTDRPGLREVLGPIRGLLGVDEVALSLLSTDEVWIETVVEEGPDRDERFALADYPATGTVLATCEALQVLASDPGADAAEVALLEEMGHRSLLMVPLLAGARSIGVLEAYATAERPWSRSQIHSARILGYQLALVLENSRLLGSR
jgi:diguanylate cyclase (GGDEF)-like protein/PAS domain S-box-containing protein